MAKAFAPPATLAAVLTVLFALVLSAAAGRASAQAKGSPTMVQGVTVPGHMAATPETAARAMSFVKTHGAPALSGQLARWTDPVCPEVTGVPADVSGYVVERIRAVATAVGAPVAKGAKCASNIEVVFTDTPQKVVDTIAHDQGVLLGFHFASQMAALKSVRRPIQAWYLTGTRNIWGDQGLDAAASSSGSDTTARSTMISQGPGAAPAGGLDFRAAFSHMQLAGQEPKGCLDSIMSHCVSSLMVHSLIVVDGKALYGRKLGPLIDYITLLALSEPGDLDACDARPSILDLLSKGCAGRTPPDELTAGDLAYLSALYKTDLEAELNIEQSNIAAIMARTPATAGP